MKRAAGALFAAITILSLDLRALIGVVANPAAARFERGRYADRAPGFTPFIENVRERTRPGDSIILILSASDAGRYAYAYYRASYLLAGRRVIPIYDDEGRMRRERVAEVRYLALFRQTYVGPGEVVWRGAEGLLVRQR